MRIWGLERISLQTPVEEFQYIKTIQETEDKISYAQRDVVLGHS